MYKTKKGNPPVEEKGKTKIFSPAITDTSETQSNQTTSKQYRGASRETFILRLNTWIPTLLARPAPSFTSLVGVIPSYVPGREDHLQHWRRTSEHVLWAALRLLGIDGGVVTARSMVEKEVKSAQIDHGKTLAVTHPEERQRPLPP